MDVNENLLRLPVKFPFSYSRVRRNCCGRIATKIFLHNFIELTEDQIEILNEKKPQSLPDLITGGRLIFHRNTPTKSIEGVRLGSCTIEEEIVKTYSIKEDPSTTTDSLIEFTC